MFFEAMTGTIATIAGTSITSTMANIIRTSVLFFRVVGIIRIAKDSYARTESPLKQFFFLIIGTLG